MAVETEARSLGETAYRSIRKEILAGHFAPGARLSPKVLSASLGMSLSVVREALMRLAEQGLVTSEPQLGFAVVDLDIEELRDMNHVRVIIEGEAVREAVAHADLGYRATLVAAHHRMSRTPYLVGDEHQTVTDEWAEAHAQFHDALIAACPSKRLRTLSKTLREATDLYRRWSGPLSSDRIERDVEGEHQALLDAALGHDADQAARLLADHINRTTQILIDYSTHTVTHTQVASDQ